MTKQVLQQALEALELAVRQNGHDMLMTGEEIRKGESAIEALRSALAQQGEPVAKYIGECHDGSLVQLYEDLKKGTELYAGAAPAAQPDAIGCTCSVCGEWQRWTPSGMVCKNGHGGVEGINHRLFSDAPAAQPAIQERKPLTDEQISKRWEDHITPVFGKNGINPIVFARAIEAAHGIVENKP